jgi:hypothetical protein
MEHYIFDVPSPELHDAEYDAHGAKDTQFTDFLHSIARDEDLTQDGFDWPTGFADAPPVIPLPANASHSGVFRAQWLPKPSYRRCVAVRE